MMSICPKCEHYEFEAAEIKVIGLSGGGPATVVQCAGCGAVFGIIEDKRILNFLIEIAKKLGIHF